MCMLPSNSSHGDAEITTELFLNVKRPSRNQCATLKTERKLPPRVTFRFVPMWPSQENVGEDWANAFIGNEPPTAAVPAAISIPLIKSRRLIPSSRFLSVISTSASLVLRPDDRQMPETYIRPALGARSIFL